MNDKKRILLKIRSRAGETISETLVALVISSLAIVMLASMISSTFSVVKKSKVKMDRYYTACTQLENFTDSGEEDSSEIITEEDGSPEVNTNEDGSPEVITGNASIQLTISGTRVSLTDSVQYKATNELGKTVAAYDYYQVAAEPDAGA